MISLDIITQVHGQNPHWLNRKSFVYLFLPFIRGKGKHLLDAGCAQGRDVRIFSKEGFVVTGLDCERKFIEEAMERGKEEYIVGDIQSLPFLDETFAIVYCANTLFYMDERKGLEELIRVLRAGGILCVSLDKRIINLETGNSFYLLDVDELLGQFKDELEVIYRKECERVDKTPFLHKHEFELFCFVKKGRNSKILEAPAEI